MERKRTASFGIKAWLLSRPRLACVFMLGFGSRVRPASQLVDHNLAGRTFYLSPVSVFIV